MIRFTSNREKRLWIWIGIVMLAIYSTLGLAGTLVDLLRDRQMLTPIFFIGMFLVGGAILTQGLKVRPAGVEIAIVLGVFAVYILTLARLAIPETERGHLLEYSVVGVFIYEALKERSKNGHNIPVVLYALLLTTLLGVLDECIQSLIPSRVFDPLDIMFNFLAGIMAVSTCVGLDWVRKKFIHKNGST